MTGYTQPDLLPFPDNYNDPADVPADVEALAQATQAAITASETETRDRILANGGAARVIAFGAAPIPAIGGVRVNFPSGGFAGVPVVVGTVSGSSVTMQTFVTVHSITSTGFHAQYWNSGLEVSGGGPTLTEFIAVGP